MTLEREATQLFNVATCDVVSVGLRRRAGQLEVVVRLDHCSLLFNFCLTHPLNRKAVAVQELRLHHIALRLMANKMGSGKS